MIYTYSTTDYYELVAGLAQMLNTEVKNNTLYFPENFGKGFLQYVKLPNGLQVNIFDMQLNTPFSLYRRSNTDEFYTLRFDEFEITESLQVQLGNNKLEERAPQKSVAYLTNSLLDFKLVAKPGMKFRGINILFNKEWMAKYLKIANADQVLTEYFNIKAREMNFEIISQEDKRIMNEIFAIDSTSPLKNMILQNRLLLLIESFFSRLYRKSQTPHQKFTIRKEDIVAINEVQRLISEKFGRQGLAIETLAELVAISPTRLKELFKKVNGIAIYEYSQQQRMKKANELIKNGISVKEAALEVGYVKYNNFVMAYQKQFPNEIA